MNMPSLADLVASRYLRKEDFEKPALVTIGHFERENVAPDNQAPEMKWVAYFKELDRGLVLNKTNAQLLAQILGGGEPAEWIGRKVVIFNDPAVSFAGRVTGGIRLRAPKQQPAPTPAQARPAPAPAPTPKPRTAPTVEDLADDIPWEP